METFVAFPFSVEIQGGGGVASSSFKASRIHVVYKKRALNFGQGSSRIRDTQVAKFTLFIYSSNCLYYIYIYIFFFVHLSKSVENLLTRNDFIRRNLSRISRQEFSFFSFSGLVHSWHIGQSRQRFRATRNPCLRFSFVDSQNFTLQTEEAGPWPADKRSILRLSRIPRILPPRNATPRIKISSPSEEEKSKTEQQVSADSAWLDPRPVTALNFTRREVL